MWRYTSVICGLTYFLFLIVQGLTDDVTMMYLWSNKMLNMIKKTVYNCFLVCCSEASGDPAVDQISGETPDVTTGWS